MYENHTVAQRKKKSTGLRNGTFSILKEAASSQRRQIDKTDYYLALLHKTMEGLASGSDSKNICLQCRRLGFDPWVRKIPCRREWLPIPLFLPRESHGQRSLERYSPWGHKESDMTEQLTFSLHKIMCRSYDKHSHRFLGRYNSAYPILKAQGRLLGGGNTLMSPKPSRPKFSHFSGI